MTLNYRADIDGLRAVAVLCVVGFHAFPNFVRGGFVGVDIFFVISGYLITSILLSEVDSNTYSITAFYARRIRRILPALCLVLAVTAATSWFILLPNEFREVSRHLGSAATFTSNFMLWREAGYFDAEAINKPLLHLWSLAIEEQFYLIFPLLLIVLVRFRISGLVIACLSLISFAASTQVTMHDADHAFYSPLTRIWELMSGALLAIHHHRSGSAAKNVMMSVITANVLSVGGALLIGVAVLSLDKSMAFPGWRAFIPVAGAALLIAAGPTSVVNRLLLIRRPMVFLGLISYPLYLWHWPLLIFNLKASGELVSATSRLMVILVSVVLAWLTYNFIERPVRLHRSPRILIPMLGALSILGLVGMAGASSTIVPRLQAAELEPIMAATTDWQFPPPAFRMLIHEGHRFAELGGRRPGATIYIGDSNVQQLAVRLAALAQEKPEDMRSVIFATRGGCLPIPGYAGAAEGCEEHLRSALRLANRADIDRIVLGGYWLNIPEGPARLKAIESLGEQIRSLAQMRRVYLLLNIPAGPEYDPRNMFVGTRLTRLHAKKSPTSLDLNTFLRIYGTMRVGLRQAAEVNGGIAIDPLPNLCPDGYCSVIATDGRPLYMDEHHMRPFHVVAAATFIDETALGGSTLNLSVPLDRVQK